MEVCCNVSIFTNEPFFPSPPFKYKMAASTLFSTSLFCSFLAAGGVSSQKIKHTSSDARPRKFCSPAKTTAILSLFLATLSSPSCSQPCPCCAGADYENLREHEIRQYKVRAWRFNFTGHYPTKRQGWRSNLLLGRFISVWCRTFQVTDEINFMTPTLLPSIFVEGRTLRGTHEAQAGRCCSPIASTRMQSQGSYCGNCGRINGTEVGLSRFLPLPPTIDRLTTLSIP